VGRALRLLERRGRWAGRGRRASQTAPAWLSFALGGCDLGERAAMATGLARFALMAEWAAYGRDLAPPWRDDEVLGVCRQVLAVGTLTHWRRAGASGEGA
jgi:hypothetical protein